MAQTMNNRSGDGFWTLHHHDARDLDGLLSNCPLREKPLLTATITSPPYGDLKDYGSEEQIGYGQDFNDYLRDMATVFTQVHRNTKPEGSLWLIADTFVSQGPSPRRLVPLPFELSAVAEEVGWTLRDVVIWHKDRTLPWSNGTRLRNAFEYVLLLVKGPSPTYEVDRLRRHADVKEWWARFPERYSPKGKTPTNVWDIPIPTQGSWGNGELAHSCPLPAELVRRLVLLSTDPDEVVLDPFAGSGMVVAVAESLGRRGLGADVVRSNVKDYERIIRPEVLAGANNSTNGHDASGQARLILDLRMLKLARVLMQKVARRRDVPWPVGALVLRGPTVTKGPPRPRVVFLVEGGKAQQEAYEERVIAAAAVPPASKFGLDPQIEVFSGRGSKLAELCRGRRIHLYVNGRTTRAALVVPHGELRQVLKSSAGDAVPPIFSEIAVDVPPRPDASVLEAAGG